MSHSLSDHSKDLPENIWSLIQQSVPIICVDILPIRQTESTSVKEIGLIYRSTPNGNKWCLIGGRVNLDSGLISSAEAEIREALGETLTYVPIKMSEALIVEYSRFPTPSGPHDPRQHSISVTFPIYAQGNGMAYGNEAKDFQWFNIAELGSVDIGFGQRSVVEELVTRNSP